MRNRNPSSHSVYSDCPPWTHQLACEITWIETPAVFYKFRVPIDIDRYGLSLDNFWKVFYNILIPYSEGGQMTSDGSYPDLSYSSHVLLFNLSALR